MLVAEPDVVTPVVVVGARLVVMTYEPANAEPVAKTEPNNINQTNKTAALNAPI